MKDVSCLMIKMGVSVNVFSCCGPPGSPGQRTVGRLYVSLSVSEIGQLHL